MDDVISCLNCKHFNIQKFGTCDAFPKGIPVAITSGEFLHTKPYQGDNGIRYEFMSSKNNSLKWQGKQTQKQNCDWIRRNQTTN